MNISEKLTEAELLDVIADRIILQTISIIIASDKSIRDKYMIIESLMGIKRNDSDYLS